MSSVEFNSIPSTIVAPIISFEVNSGGNFQNESRVLLVGHVTSAGTMDLDTPTFPASVKEARELSGAGSMLFDMYRHAILEGASDVWIMGCEDTGTENVRTLTVGSVPAAGGVGTLYIDGEELQIEIGAGDDESAVAAALDAAINSYYNSLTDAELPFTATVSGGVVSLTARHKGIICNTIDIYVPQDTGNAFAGAALVIATDTAGAGTPDTGNALAAINEDPWDWIIVPFSDAANMGRYADLLNDVSGRWKWSRQEYGHIFTGFNGTTSEITTHGSTYDDRHLSTIHQFSDSGNYHSLWAWLTAIVCRQTNWLMDGTQGGVSRNQTGLEVFSLNAPRDRSAWPNYATRDTFLKVGVSTWQVSSTGAVKIDKIITHFQTTNGAPDTTFRDIQSIAQLVYALRLFRADLTFEHAQKIAAADNPGDLQAISTPAEVEGTLINTHIKLVNGGVLVNTTEFTERVRVEINAANPNRYDIYAPLDGADPLDILAANATYYKQYS